MERLIFRNPLGQEVEFSSSSVYRWQKVDDLGGGDAVNQTTSSPFQDGSTSVGETFFNSKLVKVEFITLSDNLSEAVRTLNNYLNPKLGVGTLTYEINGVKRVFEKVKVKSMPKNVLDNSKSGTTIQFSAVVFEVFNPLYSDGEATEQSMATSQLLLEFPVAITDGFQFDILFLDGVPVNNLGDVPAPIELTIDGAVTQPLVIENATTGEKVVIGLDILEGERITITTDTDNVNVTKTIIATGETTSAFQYIDITETTFFKLQTGENLIKITGAGDTVSVATMRFKNRFVGV